MLFSQNIPPSPSRIESKEQTHFKCKDTQAESEEMWKRYFHASGNQKKIGIAKLMSDKRDIKAKAVMIDKGVV